MWTHTASAKENATLFVCDRYTASRHVKSVSCEQSMARLQMARVHDTPPTQHSTGAQTWADSFERHKEMHIRCKLGCLIGRDRLGDKCLIMTPKLILSPIWFVLFVRICWGGGRSRTIAVSLTATRSRARLAEPNSRSQTRFYEVGSNV
jgi:hypothetical protein